MKDFKLSPTLAKTWLCCRQCQAFYTRAHPCACRKEELPENKPPWLRQVPAAVRKMIVHIWSMYRS
jgi:hypothetical protein